ncbi:MAG: BlaI/MecI/CopY family transcriptional regulator [Planctomycetota bacterium]
MVPPSRKKSRRQLSRDASAPPKLSLLGPLELQVMNALWELEDATVASVLEALPAERDLHHNTVMTVMQRLTEKGYLEKYRRDGRTNGFRPAIARDAVSQRYLDMVRDELFGGSALGAMSALLDGSGLPAKKRRDLARFIEELEDDA